MDEIVPKKTGEYYMDVRSYANGCVEAHIKPMPFLYETAIRASADPDSYMNYCRENNLPFRTGPRITKDPDRDGQTYTQASFESALRRARQKIRLLVKQYGADRLFTLTYRANQVDREQVKKDFKEFLRLVRRQVPEWGYVAVLEKQDRGAYHIHCAVKGWQKITYLRRCWYKALGAKGAETGADTPGSVNVTSPLTARWGTSRRDWKPSKLVQYLTKYLSKTFEITDKEKKRYWHSDSIKEPVRERYILNSERFIDALIEVDGLIWFAYGQTLDFTHSWMSPGGNRLWVSIEGGAH